MPLRETLTNTWDHIQGFLCPGTNSKRIAPVENLQPNRNIRAPPGTTER